MLSRCVLRLRKVLKKIFTLIGSASALDTRIALCSTSRFSHISYALVRSNGRENLSQVNYTLTVALGACASTHGCYRRRGMSARCRRASTAPRLNVFTPATRLQSFLRPRRDTDDASPELPISMPPSVHTSMSLPLQRAPQPADLHT